MTADWPVDLEGITETVTTTRGPSGDWNVAALGVHAGDPATATTWGRTRTRRNFERTGTGTVQFVVDPVVFVDAALDVVTVEDPVLDEAAAWVEVKATRVDAGTEAGTEWVEWTLRPTDARVRRRTVPTTDRGRAAVVEATVAASRLGVEGYSDERLRARLDYFDRVARRCGGDAVAAAMDRVAALSDWSPAADRNERF